MGINSFKHLRLTLPKQKIGEHLLVETNMAALASWLKSLPYGNMKVTLPALLKSLSGFNRTDVSLSTRQAAMEMYNNSYQVVADYYRPRSFRLDKRQSRVSMEERALLFQLTQEMAYGYKSLAVVYSEEKGPNETLARILNLTIYYLSLVLMHHYDVYAPVPKNIWKEIHNILAYSLIFDLIEVNLPEATKTGCLNTIEHTYLRISLVAICNPYHLNIGQHWPLWAYLSYWVKHAELNEDLDDFHTNNTFVVNLKSDDRPLLKERIENNSGTEILLLSTESLIYQIIQQLDELKTSGRPPLPGFGHEINATKARRLLEIMQYHWQNFKKRASPRFDNNNKVNVIASIREIHQELVNVDPLSIKEYQGSAESFPENPQHTNEANPTDSDEEEFEVAKTGWHTLNSSMGGVCLSTGENIILPRVGELIALSENFSEHDNEEGTSVNSWKLGVIRWLQKSRTEGITVGVEYIAGELQPVYIKILGLDERKEPGILISGEEIQGKTTPTLIYANGSVPADQVVVLVIGDANLAIKPLRKIIETLSFERVFYQTRELSEAFKVAEDELKAAEEAHKKKESGDEEIELTSLPGFTQVEKVDDNSDLSIDIADEE